ncbi:MAG TPA: nicotinamide riboside transporter PnuC [Candidatus Egerieousia sp.]|nr:nicotinamide riboside transporter PnuC [Candidatus Egerieousia sp.]HPT05912.1 nicotinamide riboside transporter PnuC [Candidatus Egerieousia sp.]
MKLFKKNTLQLFDWILIAGSIIFYLGYWLYLKFGSSAAVQFSLLGAVAGVTGLVCNVLCAKRNIFNYFFGLINVSLYAYISFKNRIYGDFVLNALYYFPMQFIGFFSWMKKRGGTDEEGNKDETVVSTLKMSWAHRIYLILTCTILVVACGFILKAINDPQPFKDSATTVLSVIAMILMVMTYMEQWAIWIFVNMLSIIMWIVVYMRGGEASAEMVIMWLFYLANSINGYIVWKKAADKSAFEKKSAEMQKIKDGSQNVI